MNTTDIVSRLNQISEKSPTNFIVNGDFYIYSKLKFSRNQKGYHWTYRKDGKKFGVSSIPINSLTTDQISFFKENGSNDAKFLIDNDSGNIIELFLKSKDGNFIALDDDLLQYKSGLNIRKKDGFNGFTFLPSSPSPITENNNTNVVMYSDVTFDSLRKSAECQKNKFKKQFDNVSTSIPLQQKMSNLNAFINDFDNQIFKLFKDFPNKDINISNSGFMTFTMMIDKGSQDDIEHFRIIKDRNHKGTHIDTIDGEAMFSNLMNPIYKHLGFDKREYADRNHYNEMGDDGDFRYGTTRLDMKTRKRERNRKCNLLVNKGHENYNMFGLSLREGDLGRKGEQRRILFAGVATHEMVVSRPPRMINNSMKYEVHVNELLSLREFVIDVLLEVIQKEEN